MLWHSFAIGFLVRMIVTAIAIGKLRGMLAVVVLFLAYFRKIQIEETWLVQQFVVEYQQYQLIL